MNLPNSFSLALFVAATLCACGLDSGGGAGGSGSASGASGMGGTFCGTEVCDNRDNDCDGFIDEPPSSDSCIARIRNAESLCFSGECVLSRCVVGFFDCDGQTANGCETHVDMLPCGQCGCSGP